MSEQPEMPHPFQAGDTVAYAESFLARQNKCPSEMPVARGEVIALHTLYNGSILADIEWDKPGLPKRVNVKNLVCVGG
jgi:hypothetical protein